MPWGRLDDQLHNNGKVLSLSDKEFRVWMYSISFCLAKWLRDPGGKLTDVEAAAVCRIARAQPAIIARLVEKRGWDRLPGGGFQVHDLPVYAPPGDPTAASRMRRMRANKNGVVTPPVTGAESEPTVTVTRNGYDPVPNPVPIPNLRTTEHPQEDESGGELLTTPPAAAATVLAHPRSLEPRYSADFEAWWAAYPRKREKVDAFKAYESTRKAGGSEADLLAAARHYATAADEQGAEDRFIKLPATFLGPSRPWLDFRDGVPPVPARAAPRRNGRTNSVGAQLDRIFGET